ncbi:hypothetical protein D9M72_549340 [compost metagenome]
MRQSTARLALQFLEVDLIDRREFQKQLDGQRPLIALDQIEVGRRDAKRFRHGRLRQRQPVADAADAWPGKDLVLSHLSLPLQS